MIAMIVPLPWSRSIERLSGALAGSGTGIAFVDVRSSFTP
jgi:hypothetical protein